MIRLLRAAFLAVLAVGCNDAKVHRLEKENQELASKLNDMPKAIGLDLQKKCADEATAWFKSKGLNKEPMASYTDHYQRTMNKCFIRIEDVVAGEPTAPNISIEISDAFERKLYATCLHRFNENKADPYGCMVTLPSGQEKHCQSRKEFDELVKVYMAQ